jgi:hypothetical protein
MLPLPHLLDKADAIWEGLITWVVESLAGIDFPSGQLGSAHRAEYLTAYSF